MSANTARKKGNGIPELLKTPKIQLNSRFWFAMNILTQFTPMNDQEITDYLNLLKADLVELSPEIKLRIAEQIKKAIGDDPTITQAYKDKFDALGP